MKAKKSLNILLFAGIWFATAGNISAQQAAVGDSNARYRLGEATTLMHQGLYAQVKDSVGQLWKQYIEVDPRRLEIIYKYHKANTPDSNIVWVYHIPLMDIDSMTERWTDTTTTFFTRSASIRHYRLPEEGRISYVNTVQCQMRAGRIRNLTERIFDKIREYQQYHKATRPKDAVGIVKAAIYSFIDQHNFNTADVRKLYVNPQLYITKCQLCDGVKKAFWQYLQTKTVTTATETEWQAGLLNPVAEEQKKAMENLVSTAIEAYYRGSEFFSKQEVQDMKNTLQAERERSMRMTNNKKCANCDGACKL